MDKETNKIIIIIIDELINKIKIKIIMDELI
jgi:hypothetical protein